MKIELMKTDKHGEKDIIRKSAEKSPEFKEETVGTEHIANFNYRVERDIFLLLVCNRHTKSAYEKAIRELEKYAKKHEINPLLMTNAQADDFINSLNNSPNSIRSKISAISSFYSFLEKYGKLPAKKNPIKGTRARPQRKAVKEIVIPTDGEMGLILSNVPDLESIAICIMAYRGLRVGVLTGLWICGISYHFVSMGKYIFGMFLLDTHLNLILSKLDNQTPLKGMTTNAIRKRVYKATKKLKDKGVIGNAYSADDFRHYFAISQYRENKNISMLSKLLYHTSISTTKRYLQSLKLEV